ncbi:MAG TPA: hypothetical protein VIK01_09915 [Polyangiaceae bacterium]
MLAQTSDSLDDGITYTGALTTTGSLSLLIDGKLQSSAAIALSYGQPSLLVPAQFVAPGPGTVTLQFGHGPADRREYQSGSSFVVPRRVEYSGKVGGQSRNILTVCTSATQGSMTASIPADAGTVAMPTAPIVSADPAVCPVALSLAGQASFVWTGSSTPVTWQFSLVDGGSTTQTVAMIAKSSPAGTSCLKLDEQSQPKVLAWVVLPAQTDPGSDAGASDTGTGPGRLTVDVQATLLDCSDPSADVPFTGTVFPKRGAHWEQD